MINRLTEFSYCFSIENLVVRTKDLTGRTKDLSHRTHSYRTPPLFRAVNQFIEDLSSGKIVIPVLEEEDTGEKFAAHRRAFMFGCDHVCDLRA